ncbi:unnamed protein product [Prorocentrum cordatum]|uniref:EF-hand domain-containing protein n=1 Tax=Prorocentrum cordatum TaxID=2364126 RepID=A0ABN9RF40_9DINO|nr:unnamed protein product [Polarella glacialis]
MERCGETGLSADAWELVFGHCIRWQHPRWDHQLRGPAISAAAFAAALEDAAPCRTLAQLRRRLERRHGPPRRAWGALAGREGLEEVRLPRWRLAMQHIGIPAADAGELWALLQASVPGAVQGGCRGVARGTFLAAMQHADALTRLLDLELLQRVCRAPSGLTAAAPFALEGLDYARWPLGQEEFARELARLLRVGAEDAGLLFALLDVHGEGAVLVDDLLDALTSMQGAYLPRAAEPLDRSSSRAAPPEREAAAQRPQQASPEAVVAGRPQAPASTTPSRGLCTPTPLAASQCTSPDQVDPRNFVRASNTPRKGRPGTSLNLAIASTALPEDSDDSDEGSADRRRALAGGAPPQRPWTSMSGAAARRPAARREAGTTLRGALGGPGPERPQGVGGLAAGRCSVGAGGALSARASVTSVPLQPQGAAQRPWPASSARGASKDAAAHLPHLDQARQPEAARAASAGRGERGAAAWTGRAASARRGSPPRAGLGARRHAGAAGAGRRPASGEGPRRQRQGELGLAVIGGGRAARPAVGG